jgi:hypothetical protein
MLLVQLLQEEQVEVEELLQQEEMEHLILLVLVEQD